jgi:hypothetical protein
MAPSALPGRLGCVLIACVYLLPLWATLRPVMDADVWWHLRTGQWLIENQALPATDPFCEATSGKPWVVYSWLYAIIFYGAHAGLGLSGLLWFRVVLCLGVVTAFYRLIASREPRFLAASLLTGLISLALLPLLTERPWLVSILFAVVTLGVILEARAGRWRGAYWLLPGVFALWANMHIQFVYGLCLLALACAAPLLDRMLGWSDEASSAAASWRKLAGLAAACLLATLFNPYHLRLYQVVLDCMALQASAFPINELQSLEFRSAWEWAVLGLALLSAFRLGRRQRLSSFQVLLLAGAVICAFRSRRDVWLVAVAAAALIPSGKRRATNGNVAILEGPFPLTRKRLAAAALVVMAMAGLMAWSRNLSEPELRRAVAEAYPTRAAAYVQSRGWRGPLFNDYNWGGYLMWQLPALKVSIDGRASLHEGRRLQRSADTWAGNPGWQDDPELAAANVVIGWRSAPLATLLRTDDRFELAFEDDLAVVFVRR